MSEAPFRILKVDASAGGAQSKTRAATAAIAARLADASGRAALIDALDLVAAPPPLLTETMVAGYFTPPDDRTPEQIAAIAASDAYVAQLQAADAVVLGAPMYNFGVPAAVKAWFDQIARAGVTFRYTANGPEGLVAPKPVHVAIASGGVPLGAPVDFATPHIRQFFKFLGLADVTIHDAAAAERSAA